MTDSDADSEPDSDSDGAPRDFYVRGLVIILTSTFVLTAAFVGVLAIVSGRIDGVPGRLPWYVLISGLIFTATMLLLERNETSGRTIIVTALAIAVLGFIVATFAAEGLLYTIRNPELVVVSQLVLYFFAAGLFGTGIAYWGVNHWREFSSQPPDTQE